MTPELLLPGAIATTFVTTFAVTLLIVRTGWLWAMDHPNERSLHAHPTPRTGGLAIICGLMTGVAAIQIAGLSAPLPTLGLAFALAGISLADDRTGLPITVRLLAHLAAAGLLAAWLTGESAPWWWMTAAIVAIAAFTNFFNFMDGANGLAGGMAVAGFSTYGFATVQVAPGFSATCFLLAAAATAFLCFNLAGRIFMGDTGSVTLGFLAGAFGLEGWLAGYWPVWFPLVVFAPFAADATLTLVRRMLRRDRFWEAHREHYYQRLVRSGVSHSRLAVGEYVLMAVCAGAALAARTADTATRNEILATIGTLLALAALGVDRRWRKHTNRRSSGD